MTANNLKRTPLYDLIVTQNARLTPFSGWEMPVQFSGLKNEHLAVRTSVGMFDISHMGKFALEGKKLRQTLQTLVPSDLEPLEAGKAQYTVLLNPQGGIIDDIIFYYQGQTNGIERGMLIVNAATTRKDKEWILKNLPENSLNLTDLSLDNVLIALQGVKAVNILQTLLNTNISSLKAFEHLEAELYGETAFIARTGYTGEDGFEIMIKAEAGQKLWQTLLTEGVIPCGLGARDTLRLEAAMCLYGQDINDNTTPLEAGLGWIVHLDKKGEFIGRNILEKQKEEGLTRRLVALEMTEKGIARHGYSVVIDSNTVGEVTSGTLAPTVEKAIALAYLPRNYGKVGQKVSIEIRGKLYPAIVVKKPFYRSPSRLAKG
ncbi:MAG: glycine cleavage system aminomethyltransferase GcvT [Microcystaceae cyanobacterium]